MWFVEVLPRLPAAAQFHVALDGGDILNFVVGGLCFEVFPVKTVEETRDRHDP